MDIFNFNGIRPVLMNEAGGESGGGGGAVAVAEPVSTALVPTGGDGGADLAALDTGGADDDPGTDLTTTDGADGNQGRKVNPALALLKSHADPEIKKFGNQAHQAIAVRTELRKLFPGQSPIAAVKTLQQDMVALAGRHYNTPDPRDPERRTGIQQIRDRMAEFEEVDLLFYSGDPKILDGMTADDEGKAAFAKLAPAMKAKWRQIAPRAFAADAARQILADAKDAFLVDQDGKDTTTRADVPLRIERAYQLLGENATPQDIAMARNQIIAVYNWFSRLERLAAMEPETFVSETGSNDTKLQERERRIAEREENQRNAEWNSARQTMANQIVQRTFKTLTKGREIPADELEDMQALYTRRFDAAIKQREPRADETRKGYIEAQDREGYLAYEKRLVETYGIPALKTEVERMLKRLAPAKPGAAPAAASASAGTQGTSRPAPAPQGYFKLSAKPPIHVINNMGRTREMVMAKQATLRVPWEGRPAGSKVTW